MSARSPVGSAGASVVWELGKSFPAVLAAALRKAPWLARDCARLRGRSPAARTCRTFQSKGFLRPDGHHRSFYLRRPGGAVIGVKGGDIAAADLDAKLGALGRSRGPLRLTTLEQLAITERKVPMALTLEEGLEQARQAAAFQAAYLARYGELARLPVPLLVLRWPRLEADRFAKVLLSRLSPAASGAVRGQLSGGLSILLYYYPCVPQRVLHLSEVLCGRGARSYDERMSQARGFGALLAEPAPAAELVSRWVNLLARMLALGFLPSDASHRLSGQLLQEQNAVLDGGFVDVEPLRPMSEFRDDRSFYEAVLLSWLDLSATVKRLLVGHLDRADLSWPFADFSPAYLAVPAAIAAHVAQRLRERLREEARAGAAVDPRIWRVLGDGWSGLEAVLSRLFEDPRPAR